MSNDKRFKAWKRQRRKRKTSKEKIRLYEAGKIAHDKLPSLAKRLLSRKHRTQKKTA